MGITFSVTPAVGATFCPSTMAAAVMVRGVELTAWPVGAVSVRMEVAPEPIDGGLKDPVIPAGRPATLRVASWLKPLVLESDKATAADWPGRRVGEEGKAATVKELDGTITRLLVVLAELPRRVTVTGPAAVPGGMTKVREFEVTLETGGETVPPPIAVKKSWMPTPKLLPETVIRVPGDADLGLKSEIVGPAAVTLKPLVSVATSTPVVMVTVRGPGAAVEAMVRLAVAWVALVTVVLLTVIPAPKLATVAPCRKLEKLPVIATLRICPA
jgi:hypothetical protein